MLEEELDDTHLCIKCSTTIVGIENYVQHRKTNCIGAKTSADSGHQMVQAVNDVYASYEFSTEQNNFHKASEEVEKTHQKSLSDAYELPYDLGADVFFSSLELQSSSKRSNPMATTSAGPSSVTSGGKNVFTRSVTRKLLAPVGGLHETAPDHDDDWIEPSSNSDNLMKAVRDISGHKKCADPVFKLLTFHQDSPEPSDSEDNEEDEDFGAPPRTHTGGKWKPDHQATLRHSLLRSSPAWDDRHQWEMPDHCMDDHDHDLNLNDQPPPSHTKGKWVPGTKMVKLDYKDEIEVEKIFSNQYWCNTCNRKLSSKLLYERHLKSNLHIKRSEPEIELGQNQASRPLLKFDKVQKRIRTPSKYLNSDMYNVSSKRSMKKTFVSTQPIQKSSKRKRNRRKYFTKCETCKTRLPKRLLAKHLISHYHYRRMAMDPAKSFDTILQNIEKIVRQSPFQCRPCRFYCNTERDFMQHWNSPGHLNCTDESPGTRFWCLVCKFECEDNNQMRHHLLETEHQEVILAINRSFPIVIGKKVIIECLKCRRIFRYNIELRKHTLICTEKPSGTASNEYQSKFKCTICNKISKSRLALQKHEMLSHKKREYFCNPCQRIFESALDAKIHRGTTDHKIRAAEKIPKNHKKLERKCYRCEEICENVLELKKHLKSKHPDAKFICPRCSLEFLLPQELGSHIRMKICQPSTSKVLCKTITSTDNIFINSPSKITVPTPTQSSEPSSAIFIPLITSLPPSSDLFPRIKDVATTATTKSMVSSRHASDSAISGSIVEPPTHSPLNILETTTTPVIEELLKETSSQEDCVSHHEIFSDVTAAHAEKSEDVSTTSNTNIWPCETCNFKTNLEAEYLYHKILHKIEGTIDVNAKLQCSLCEKVFRKNSLRCHLRQHTNERIFPCQQCTMSFTRKHNLKNHIAIVHAIGKKSDRNECKKNTNFQCDTCGKVFNKKYSLKCHISTHVGRDKNFKCPKDLCIFIGRSSSDLKRHLAIHSDEKIFKCSVRGCNYEGKNSINFQRHLKVHKPVSKEFVCPNCDYKTGISGHLKRHTYIHTGEKRYKCPHCDFNCNALDNLRKHILTTTLHPGKYIYECKLCPLSAKQHFKTNFFKEFHTHMKNIHSTAAAAANDLNNCFNWKTVV